MRVMSMKPLVLSVLASASLAACCSSTSSTTPVDEGGLFIRGCLALPRDTCQTQVSSDATFVLSGRLDGLYRDEYTCVALVESLRTDAHPVTLRDARVRVLGPDPVNPPVIASFTTAVAGLVDPSDAGSPGLAATEATLIDTATAKILTEAAASAQATQQVVVMVSVRGITADGTEVTSKEFGFPIEVCAGCTCTMPLDDLCVGPAYLPGPDCLLGQDDTVDCRYLQNDACKRLECDEDPSTGKSLLETARCPAQQGGADGSCCDP